MSALSKSIGSHCAAHRKPRLDVWQGFRGRITETFTVRAADLTRFYEVCIFGDSEQLADELAALVLSGVKRATAGSVWSYEAEGKRLPAPGDLSIVTNWAGQPLCVIETSSVVVLPFNQVSAEFAAIEGEGDGSLEFWRKTHRDYFERECHAAGKVFTEDVLISCEQFRVVYQPSAC